ncbi:MAG: HAD family hydrolase [Bacteroidota bacterium]|nr:HAD family hydrolase [Bacteroidota bacterium]
MDPDQKTIIWDWSGTLLDDIHLSMNAINVVLKKRTLPLLNIDRYRNIFGFPIREYYQRIGFDFSKEPFDIPAQEYIQEYYTHVHECSLHEQALDTLSHFKQKGYRQFVLSAMEQSSLEMTLKQQNIFHFFEKVAGLDNHHAASKLDVGKHLLKTSHIENSNTWFIGDTTHDFEVASDMECHCILIAKGHQSEERLKATGAPVVQDI